MRTNYLQQTLEGMPPRPHKFHNPLWERLALMARSVDMEMGYRSDIPAGLELLTGGGRITTATITGAVAAGYTGIFLDPRYVWNADGLRIGQLVLTATALSGITVTVPSTSGIQVTDPVSWSGSATGTGTVASITNSTQFVVTVLTGSLGATAVYTFTATSGVNNFTIESRMGGTVPFGTAPVPIPPTGYISTGSSVADGIQIFGASNPTGTNGTSGIIFLGVAFVGTNSNAVVHIGGGQTAIYFGRCFIDNLSTSANTYGYITDTNINGLTSEDTTMDTVTSNGWAGVGIGIANVGGTQTNDCLYINLRTQGINYGIRAVAGGGHNFYNWYDRSGPLTAGCANSGATLYFHGGEDDNSAVNAGPCHTVSNGTTVINDRNLTQSGQSGASTHVIEITSTGIAILKGYGRINGTAPVITIAGSGKLDLSDNHYDAHNVTISGSAGTLSLAQNSNYAPPTYSAYTGTIKNFTTSDYQDPSTAGWAGSANSNITLGATGSINAIITTGTLSEGSWRVTALISTTNPSVVGGRLECAVQGSTGSGAGAGTAVTSGSVPGTRTSSATATAADNEVVISFTGVITITTAGTLVLSIIPTYASGSAPIVLALCADYSASSQDPVACTLFCQRI